MRRFVVALALLCAAVPAFGQTTYPTVAGSRVNGVVPLQCDTNGANCAPVSNATPQIVEPTGVYNTTAPTLIDGQRGDFTLGQRGAARVELVISGPGAGVPQYNGDSTDATAATGSGVNIVTMSRSQGFNGTTWDRIRSDVNGLVVQPGLSATNWFYTSGVTPILSNTTTAVTIKTAAGASVRNYIDSCQIATTAFGAAVPLAIRDGAGGTVLWANTVPTGGWLTPVAMIFQMPLRGTANTLLEIVTTTANTSGTVTANCQGHTGT